MIKLNSMEIPHALMMVSKLMKREYDHQIYESIHSDKITGENLQILGFLDMNPDKEIYQKDIEKFFSLRASTVSANLRLMEKKGLITREYSTADTRLKKVSATPKSLELKGKIQLKTKEMEKKFNDVLSKEERKILLDLLLKMKSALE